MIALLTACLYFGILVHVRNIASAKARLKLYSATLSRIADKILFIHITEVRKFIIFADADDNSTQYVSLDTNYFVSQFLFYHHGTQRPIALDYDPVEDRVYWSDTAQGRIISAFFNATSAKALFRCNVRTPYGLAIDYVGRNIYWTDTGTNRIEVGLLDGTGRKLLIKDELDEPRAIVLHLTNR